MLGCGTWKCRNWWNTFEHKSLLRDTISSSPSEVEVVQVSMMLTRRGSLVQVTSCKRSQVHSLRYYFAIRANKLSVVHRGPNAHHFAMQTENSLRATLQSQEFVALHYHTDGILMRRNSMGKNEIWGNWLYFKRLNKHHKIWVATARECRIRFYCRCGSELWPYEDTSN